MKKILAVIVILFCAQMTSGCIAGYAKEKSLDFVEETLLTQEQIQYENLRGKLEAQGKDIRDIDTNGNGYIEPVEVAAYSGKEIISGRGKDLKELIMTLLLLLGSTFGYRGIRKWRGGGPGGPDSDYKTM